MGITTGSTPAGDNGCLIFTEVVAPAGDASRYAES